MIITTTHFPNRMVYFSVDFLLVYPLRNWFTNHFEWPKWVSWILLCEITRSFGATYPLMEWRVALTEKTESMPSE